MITDCMSLGNDQLAWLAVARPQCWEFSWPLSKPHLSNCSWWWPPLSFTPPWQFWWWWPNCVASAMLKLSDLHLSFVWRSIMTDNSSVHYKKFFYIYINVTWGGFLLLLLRITCLTNQTVHTSSNVPDLLSGSHHFWKHQHESFFSQLISDCEFSTYVNRLCTEYFFFFSFFFFWWWIWRIF